MLKDEKSKHLAMDPPPAGTSLSVAGSHRVGWYCTPRLLRLCPEGESTGHQQSFLDGCGSGRILMWVLAGLPDFAHGRCLSGFLLPATPLPFQHYGLARLGGAWNL